MPARDALSVVFAALADPTRRAILTQLRRGPTTAGDVAAPFAMSRSAISQHLRVLEDAGLIERTVTAQWRTCVLRTEPLDEVADVGGRPPTAWDERFDLLDERLRADSDDDTGEADHDRDGPDQKTFTITRIFDAPRAAIWHAWTDPDEAAAWWHPRGVVTPRDSVELDVRPGRHVPRTRWSRPTAAPTRRAASTARSSSRERSCFTWADPGDPQDDAPRDHRDPGGPGASGRAWSSTWTASAGSPATRASTTGGTRRSTSSTLGASRAPRGRRAGRVAPQGDDDHQRPERLRAGDGPLGRGRSASPSPCSSTTNRRAAR